MFGRNRFVSCAVLVAILMFAVPVLGHEDVAVREYGGDPISLDVQEAEISTVLRSLAGFSGANIVASPRVVGKVTVKLENVRHWNIVSELPVKQLSLRCEITSPSQPHFLTEQHLL